MKKQSPQLNHFASDRNLLRSKRGQGLVILMILFGLIFFPLLMVLSFEFARLYLAKQELQNACDAAALTAAATLAGSINSSPTQAHNDAIESALKIFKANSALGQTFTNSSSVPSASSLSCNSGESKLYFEFLNPVTLKPEPITSANGKLVKLSACTGYDLAFGQYIGIKSWNASAVSTSVLPKLDLVICFDVSGSMDDQTPVTFAKRVWDDTLGGGKITYSDLSGANGPTKGKIFDILKPAITGTSFNGSLPQFLTESYWSANTYFSEYLASYYGVQGLRSAGVYPEAGAPPGNYPPGTAPTFDGFKTFTDVVVNIDGNNIFSGFTYDGFAFPDKATLVEAARGNLESASVFNSSKANTSVSVSPKAGYQKAYYEAAGKQLKPINEAKVAVLAMTELLNTAAETHFGFVAFDGNIGSAPDSTEEWNSVDDASKYGTKRGFPLPRVVIDKAAGATQFDLVNKSINSCVAMGSTNIGASVHAAVQDLKSNSRAGSVKAIILFTDGTPTVPSGPLSSDPKANARMAAAEARDAGIAVYTIGLAQNPLIIPDQEDILNDTNSDPTTGGMAGIAGHGSTFNLVTDSSELNSTFAKIARQLVRLVSNQ
jgi:Flp pilus assembly protein TadG